MQTYLRMLGFIRPYLGHVIGSVVLMIFFSFVSTTSLWMISPFLGTLFEVETPMGTAFGPEPSAPVEDATTVDDATVDGDATAVEQIQGRMDALKEWRDEIKAKLDTYLLQGTREEALLRIVIVFFVLFLLKNITGYFQQILMAYVSERLIQTLRNELYMQFTRLPLGFFHRHRAGELISRATNDVLVANRCVNVSFTNLVRDPILLVMYASHCSSAGS